MSKKELYELGAEAKREIGEHTDKVVLEHISRNQGIILYDLAKELSWTRGKVLGSVQRLSRQSMIKTKTVLRHGKVVRIIYTAEYEEPKPDILEVPYTMIDLERWKGVRNAYVYALNRLSFLIESPALTLVNGTDVKRLFADKVELEHLDKKMRVKLPAKIVDFYILHNSDITLSSIGDTGDNVLVTVEQTSLPLSY